MYHIAIVDDHTLFRQGIHSLLESREKLSITGSYANAGDFLADLENRDFDIVLLDISLPDKLGFDVLKEIRQTKKDTRVIMLSMHSDLAYVTKALKMGAYAYVLKNVSESYLIDTIEKVASGVRVFEPDQFDQALDLLALKEEIKKPSNREQEILEYVAQGLTTKEIAEKLFVSVRTVETHRNNLMKKFQVQNTAELIGKAVRLKMI